jgi:hypothetical protein
MLIETVCILSLIDFLVFIFMLSYDEDKSIWENIANYICILFIMGVLYFAHLTRVIGG